MRRSLLILTTAICTVAASSSAFAHHSQQYLYDPCRIITIEGRVESVQWKDPHSWIVLRLDDGTAYTVDWMGLRGLTSRQIISAAQKELVPGTRVAVIGYLIRDAAEIRGYFPNFKNDIDPRTVRPGSIRSVGDSFTWTATPNWSPAAPDCGRK